MMTTQAISCSLCALPAVHKNRGFSLRSRGTPAKPQYSFRFCDQSTEDRRFRSLNTSRCFLLDVVAGSSVDPVGHLAPPPGASPGSWTWWILGVVVSVVLPFTKSKWGPLLKLKNEVEAIVEMAEEATEVVEKVAEGVEKVAEDVAELLPEGGKLRSTVEFVEHVAEVTAKDARMVEGFIEKVEELEKEVEGKVDSILERPAPKL
ncbi:hypothetical protein SAY87_024461 [Trapa incisa]|uniref:Uncharacterized protein n=1 Tax=Trapa incisa TaxID=236973 RepID=A0AAN7JFY2_9MYRT|nr:hypothetical protein SAY87_024461 [Trapa incisa]